MEEFIRLSYYPVCVSGANRINLGKGKVGGAWKSLSYYPIILYVFVGSDRTDFSKTRVLDRTSLFYPINVVCPFWGFILSKTGFRSDKLF